MRSGLGGSQARRAQQFQEKEGIVFGLKTKVKYCGSQVGVRQQTR
jgi:hypothetical protein